MKKPAALVWIVILLSGCVSSGKADRIVAFDRVPHAAREFRGLWVATVSNLDWPSGRGLSVEEQQAEAVAILDRAVELNFNAIMFQARPVGDAFYASRREPWSIFLTGTMGKDPGYDPLAFWVAEAHKRGLQLHAWINPYRVGSPSIGADEYAASSPVLAQPELVKKIGSKGYHWMNPGDSRSERYVLDVVDDIVSSYDIDGLVLDDYFYPYAEYYDPSQDFPDDDDYAAAIERGFAGDKAAWRRGNIDALVRSLYHEVKSRKARVLVGISPFGIWRPTFPPSISGKDAYAEIYTDTRLWLNEGWLDYFAPQLYWPIKQAAQSLPVLLEWWKGENIKGRHLWPALNVGYASASNIPTPEIRGHEYASQILVTRGMLPASPGFVMFRALNLLESVGGRPNDVFQGQQVTTDLRSKALTAEALVPRTPWIDSGVPERPYAHYVLAGNRLTIYWQPARDAFRYVVYVHRGSAEYHGRIWWESDILPASASSSAWEMIRAGKAATDAIDMVVVTAVNRMGEESDKAIIEVERQVTTAR